MRPGAGPVMVGPMGAPKPKSPSDLQRMLREAGLRSTAARLAVLRELHRVTRPVSHSDLAELLKDEGFDRTTIYRNLTDLTEVGLARRADLGDHVWRFELLRAVDGHPDDPHAHFTCTDCGTVECLPEDAVPLTGLPQGLSRKGVEVQVRGVCESCD
jgi:Fur family ferric uptake transcriptional regulator